MNSLPGSEDNLLIKCIGFPENNTIIKHKILLQRSEQHQLSLFYFLYTLFAQQQQKTFASHQVIPSKESSILRNQIAM